MKNKTFCLFAILVLLLPLAVINCTSQQPSKDCSQCEQALDQAKKEIADLQQKLDSANRLVEELKKTPEQVYQTLVEKAEQVGDSRSAGAAIEEVDSFIAKNPTSPLLKSAQQLKGELQKKLKTYETEEARQAALKALDDIKASLAGIKDGEELDALTLMKLAQKIQGSYSLQVLKQLPQTGYKAAMKDPDAERGAVISARGTVIQIRKEALPENFTIYEGILLQSGFNAVYFIALGSTKGIYEDSWANFTGVFAQIYSYPNAGGGTTHSVVAVGYFDIPENR